MLTLNRKQKGFTLLELLVTISIISVLLTIALKSVGNSVDSQSASDAGQQAMYALNRARYYAKTKGIVTHVYFGEGTNQYIIEENDGNSLLKENSIDGSSGELPDGVTVLENTCGDIFFNIDGTPLLSVDPSKEPMYEVCRITVGNSASEKSLIILPHSGSITYE